MDLKVHCLEETLSVVVISINRSKPTREFGVKFKTDLEEDNTSDVKLILNAPIGDNGGLKVSLRRLQSDNFAFNVTRNEKRKNERFNCSIDRLRFLILLKMLMLILRLITITIILNTIFLT